MRAGGQSHSEQMGHGPRKQPKNTSLASTANTCLNKSLEGNLSKLPLYEILRRAETIFDNDYRQTVETQRVEQSKTSTRERT